MEIAGSDDKALLLMNWNTPTRCYWWNPPEITGNTECLPLCLQRLKEEASLLKMVVRVWKGSKKMWEQTKKEGQKFLHPYWQIRISLPKMKTYFYFTSYFLIIYWLYIVFIKWTISVYLQNKKRFIHDILLWIARWKRKHVNKTISMRTQGWILFLTVFDKG